MPLASVWALKDMFMILQLTWTTLLSITIFFSPLSTLLPTVPGEQYPGKMTQFLGSVAHYLKTSRLVPAFIIPGVAKRTIGVFKPITFQSKFLTNLKSKMFSPC